MLSPVSFSRDKTIDALFPDCADVPEMCIAVNRDKECQIFTHFRFTAFPAACDLFFLAALSDFAERRAATIPASLIAPELHHDTKQIVTLLVMLEGFTHRNF